MALWLIRAGSHGEFETKFLEESRVYVTWNDLAQDLSKLKNKAALIDILGITEPGAKPKKLSNHASQICLFAHVMQKGDWVVLPLKTQQSIYIGEITGDYQYEKSGPNPYFHWRPVKWIGEAIPRQRFGQDLLYSFGAFLTICSIKRNNAEARVKVMKASGWKDDPGKKGGVAKTTSPTKVSGVGEAGGPAKQEGEPGVRRLVRRAGGGLQAQELADAWSVG
jgi:restriction system protein